MNIDFKKLNRFTTIPFLLDILRRKKITLLNPIFWEDFNDKETIEIYRKLNKSASVYALCMTFKNETIHHWNAFSNGTSGCCIEFKPLELIEKLEKNKIMHGKVEYIKVRDLKNHNSEIERIPFAKREPFSTENEYRLIYTSNDPQKASAEFDIDINSIRKITFSNKIPEQVYETIKELIPIIAPEYKGEIYRSTLFNNNTWIKHFKNYNNGS